MTILKALVSCSLLFAGPVVHEAAKESAASEQHEIPFQRVSECSIPEGIPKPRGTIVETVTWTDSAGENIIVIAEYHAGRVLEHDYASELTAFQYTEEDSSFELVWDIKDFDYADADVSYSEGTLKVFDVDGDNLGEASFFYSIANAEREVIKYMLHTKGKKLAIRGYWNVGMDREAQLSRVDVDSAFDQLPELFKDFATEQWDAVLSPGGSD